MTIEQIDRAYWHGFFETLTRTIQGQEAEVEIASAEFGDQRLAESIRLLGISYDSHGDSLEIALDGMDHRVAAPGALYVNWEHGAVRDVEVMGSDNVRTAVHLKEPLLLPGQGSSG